MDPFEQLESVISRIKELNEGTLSPTQDYSHALEIAGSLFEYYGQTVELAKLVGHPIQILDPSKAESVEKACDIALLQIQQLELIFKIKKGSTSVLVDYENHLVRLSKEQVEEIEEHINEARQKIRSSNAFEEKHKRRLLNRLEKLQAEINKKISDLDVMLAGVTEVTAVAGKSARNLEPVVDLFKKIFTIAEGETDEPLGLPSPPKQIEDKSGESES
ncbi:hypothetical protein [Ruegeria sp. HKCCD6119]|uniref:hypothetical protein n=1 Tax=Ruegeria sp. HKCCD6119 TaxID=2683003 RepID=UPI001492B636|nr:hypothetical protein [Ruegeria sp. HKCCD6119]NOD83217.1 hypothetical protein [Ruegeria sp. HKCCD6119]